MQKIYNLKVLLSFWTLISIAGAVSAQAETKKNNNAWIAGHGGYDRADKSNFTIFGGSFGARSNKIAGGLFILMTPTKSSNVGSFRADIQQTLWGAEFRLLPDKYKVLHLGLRAGLSYVSGRVQVGAYQVSASQTDFFGGALFGLEAPLTKWLSLGVEADYLYVTASPGYSVILGLGTLRFWF